MQSPKKQLIQKEFKTQDLKQSAGILEDFVVRKVVNTQEGTIEKAPVNNNDIANKAYVDTHGAGADNLGNHIATQTISGANLAEQIYLGTTGADVDPTIIFETKNSSNIVKMYLDETETENHFYLTGNNTALDTNFNIRATTGENALFSVGTSDTNKGSVLFSSGDIMRIRNHLSNTDIRFQINDGGVNIDLVSLDGSESKVGIGPGTTSPQTVLHISGGALTISNTIAPTTPSNAGAIFISGGALYYIGSAGTTTSIAPA